MSIENTRDSLDKAPAISPPAGVLRAVSTDSMLLVVDMQIRLLPAISNWLEVRNRVERVIRAARLLEVLVRVTEHCPDAIGGTDLDLRAQLANADILTKRSFNALDDPDTANHIKDLGRQSVAICGVEAHVCVAQTALGLRAAGYDVFVLEDACGSRHEGDRLVGLARLLQAGCVPMTLEAMVFEWLGHADHPRFRDLLALIKEA